jgi:hypothetical protein
MKRLALLLVLTLFLAFTAIADDGQIPIGGRTNCNGPCPTSLTTTPAPDSTTDSKEVSDIGSTIILDALRSMIDLVM